MIGFCNCPITEVGLQLNVVINKRIKVDLP